MTEYDREIAVPGHIRDIYVTLANHLNRHDYTLRDQDPPHHITVAKGNKAKAALLSTADWEELEVTLSPMPQSSTQVIIRFHFDFPTWTSLVAQRLPEASRVAQFNKKVDVGSFSVLHKFTLKGKLAESDRMVDDFAQIIGNSNPDEPGFVKPSSLHSGRTIICPSCSTGNVVQASFCKKCGTRLSPST